MNVPECEHEQEVIEALRSGRWAGPWGEAIRAHAALCAVCSEVALVAKALRREEQEPQHQRPLPSAGLVWWKAQLAARRAAEARAAQPIAWVEQLAQFFGVLAVLSLAWWQWPRVLGWWNGSTPTRGFGNTLAGALEWLREIIGPLSLILSQSPSYLIVASAGAVLTLLAFTAYVVWREE